MRLRMADVLPSPLTMITVTVMVWVTTRLLQLLAKKVPAVLLGGVIPASN